MSSRTGWVVAVAVLLAGTAVGAVVLRTHRDHPPSPLTLQIGDRSVSVAAGETLGDAIDAFALHPSAGRLLDVNGRVIRPSAFPGSVRVNGRPTAMGAVLRNG